MLVRYNSLWRALRAFPHSGYSSTPVVVAASASPSSPENVPKASEISAKKTSDDKSIQHRQKLVVAAFSSLKSIDDTDDSLVDDELNLRIACSETVQSLLSLSEAQGLTRNHALKIVSKLADWTSENKVKLIEFEGDPRFVNLCRTLGHVVQGRSVKGERSPSTPSGFSDLGVVLGVAGDDEAAKLVNTITVPQMIKVLSSLAYKKRRSIPLLRSLAFNIGKSSDELNIKDCADILYACAQLSFQDEVLFEKVCSDLCHCINKNNKPAVVGSIITSLGLLKYKDKELLENICNWVMKNFTICRIQDLSSLVLTLATVNHIPVNQDKLFQKLEMHLQQSDMATPLLWLDIVWALVILNKANTNHIASVLSEEFIDRLASSQPDGLSVVSKLKLLNVNGAAKLLVDKYSGPLIESDSEITKVEVPRAKDKQAFVATVIDTLSNLLPSSVYMNSNINTGMGYIIDSECIVDANLTPLPLVDKKTGKSIDRSQPGVRKGIKVAMLVLDYHDVTKGEADPIGIASLAIRLTERSGYKTIIVPYYDFNPRDKLVTRVQYLEQRLKNIIRNNNNSNAVPPPVPLSSHPQAS